LKEIRYPSLEVAEKLLQKSEAKNPGAWIEHSRYTAFVCERIAQYCPHLDKEKAYLLGLLHDIGRYVGVVSERHLLEGYLLCHENGWDEVARICVTHSYMLQDITSSIGVWDVSDEDYQLMKIVIETSEYNDYDRLVQLADALALPTGVCIIEKRLVDVVLRYGFHPHTIARWRKTFEIKNYFEAIMGLSIYQVLCEPTEIPELVF